MRGFLQFLLAASVRFSHYSSALAPPRTRIGPHTNLVETKSYVELIDPETKCKVVLLGCLHGSVSSSNDVQLLLGQDDITTDAVVLELCPSRIKHFRRRVGTTSTRSPSRSAFQDFAGMVNSAYTRRGLPTAVATFFLGGMRNVQTALSGSDAGLEFATAIRIAQDSKIPIMVGDRAVDETLHRAGSLPLVSFGMLKDFISDLDWSNTYGYYCSQLVTAIFGNKEGMPEGSQVTTGQVLLRNKQAIADIFRVTVPPLVLAVAITMFVHLFVGSLPVHGIGVGHQHLLVETVSEKGEELSLASSSASMETMLRHIVSEMATSAAIFLLFVLPAVKTILFERDAYLARSIKEACEKVVENGDHEDSQVVAVLGLLHVNCVAREIMGVDQVQRVNRLSEVW